MNQHQYRNAFIYLSIAMLVVVCFLLMHIWEQDKYKKSLQSTVSHLNSEIETRTNREGKLISERQTAELRVKDLETSMPKLAEAIARDFGIKLRNLRGYMSAEFQARGGGNASVKSIPWSNIYINALGDTLIDRSLLTFDTLQTKFSPFAVVAQDGYLDFQADVYDSLNAPYVYTYSDTAQMAFIKKGRWYQRKKLYGSVMFSNPQATVSNTSSILVKEYTDKRFGIGPYIGIGVTGDLQLQTNFGISLHYSLIRF